MQLVAKGGSMRLVPVPSIGANIAAGVAAYAIERAAQPALEYLGEKLARGLYSGYEAIFGDTDGMTFDELQARVDDVIHSSPPGAESSTVLERVIDDLLVQLNS